MHWLKTILACAAVLLLISRSVAQDPAYSPPAGMVPPMVTGGTETLPLPVGSPSTPSWPAAVTRIDPECAANVPPTFDVTVESILWRMEHTRNQAMIINPGMGTETRTDALDLGLRIGPRVNVTYLADEGIEDVQGIETSYFGIYDWSDSLLEIAPAGTSLRLPDRFGDAGVTTDFCNADRMRVQYDIRLNSVELNLLLGKLQSPFSWIFGARFIRLEEDFNLDSFTANRMSFYQVNTRNDLYGVQWGARWRVSHGNWTFIPVWKTGIYNNNAQQSTLVTDNDRTVVLRNYSTDASVASCEAEGGFAVAYQFSKCWSARIGYNVLWMNNVARATDQLDFSNNAISGSRVFLREDAVAHGLNVGLERRW